MLLISDINVNDIEGNKKKNLTALEIEGLRIKRRKGFKVEYEDNNFAKFMKVKRIQPDYCELARDAKGTVVVFKRNDSDKNEIIPVGDNIRYIDTYENPKLILTATDINLFVHRNEEPQMKVTIQDNTKGLI